MTLRCCRSPSPSRRRRWRRDTPPPAPTTAPTEGQTGHQRLQPVAEVAKEISAILERNKRYPSEARANRQQGVAKIAFNMDRQGKVLSTRLVTSSGSSALDQEALSLTQRSQFPPPPRGLCGGRDQRDVPVASPRVRDMRFDHTVSCIIQKKRKAWICGSLRCCTKVTRLLHWV